MNHVLDASELGSWAAQCLVSPQRRLQWAPNRSTYQEVNEQMNGVKHKSLREKQFIQLGWRRATVLETVILKTGD